LSRLFGKIRVLNDREMSLLHEGALRILERVGMKVYHAGAREYLKSVGCRVDANSLIVKFPPEAVQAAVDEMRSDFGSPRREGLRQAIRFTESSYFTRPDELQHDFTVNSGGFNAFIFDLQGNRRTADGADVRDSLKLVNALEEITWSGLPCADQSIPHPLRPVKMAAELIKHTNKIGGIEAWAPLDIEYLQQIALVVRGSQAELQRRPCLVGYGESRTPLALDENMAEIFIEYVRRGMPQSLDTMPSAGTTAPASGAGTLAVGLAETLAGLVLGKAVRTDAVLSIDATPGYCDMKNLIFPYAGAERMPLLGGWIQMLREFYGITAGAHGGKTNSCLPGFQAGMEKAHSILFPLLCGASGIGTIGQIEFGITYSPLQMVLDAEVVRATKRILQGFEVNEHTLALELIEKVGPEGNFMAEEHTAEHFREEFWLSELTECDPWEAFSKKQVRGMEKLAEEKARAILAAPLEPVLSSEQIAEIDRIVAHAEKKILGQ